MQGSRCSGRGEMVNEGEKCARWLVLRHQRVKLCCPPQRACRVCAAPPRQHACAPYMALHLQPRSVCLLISHTSCHAMDASGNATVERLAATDMQGPLPASLASAATAAALATRLLADGKLTGCAAMASRPHYQGVGNTLRPECLSPGLACESCHAGGACRQRSARALDKHAM